MNAKTLGGDDLYISNIDVAKEYNESSSGTDTANDYNDNKYNSNEIIDMKLSIKNNTYSQKSIHIDFIRFSILFSLNHGGVVSCISLVTTRLSGILSLYLPVLYASYTLSAVMGVTYAVKSLGGHGKGAVTMGMWINCVYIGCFALAMAMVGDEGDTDNGGGVGTKVFVIIGGLLGGLGSGLLWTAQGSYFTRVSAKYANASDINKYKVPEMTHEKASKELGGQFAAIYITGELTMRILSTVAISILDWSWVTVFVWYSSIVVGSASLMPTAVTQYSNKEVKKSTRASFAVETASVPLLFWTDRKMRHIIPFCVLFPLTSSFVTSFVNEEVLLVVSKDNDTIYIKLIGSVVTIIAAVASVPFARLAQRTGNGVVFVVGCVAFALTSLLFVVMPDLEGWNVWRLLVVYGLQGIGRATFEGNLRAEFAIIFFHDEASAFANIVLWGGIFSTIGFLLTTNLGCPKVSTYCIKYYHDGSLHNVLLYELLVLTSTVLAIGGLLRLSSILKSEERVAQRLSKILRFKFLNE